MLIQGGHVSFLPRQPLGKTGKHVGPPCVQFINDIKSRSAQTHGLNLNGLNVFACSDIQTRTSGSPSTTCWSRVYRWSVCARKTGLPKTRLCVSRETARKDNNNYKDKTVHTTWRDTPLMLAPLCTKLDTHFILLLW